LVGLLFLLLSGFNLRCLAADLTGTSEETANLASYKQDVDIDCEVFENCNAVKPSASKSRGRPVTYRRNSSHHLDSGIRIAVKR
jgi:hypothetical protein